MREIDEKELEKVKGGAMLPWIIAGGSALVIFLIGAFDGYTRPFACRE